MTYNRKQIMTLAWAWARQDLWSLRLPASHLRRLFNANLKAAWAEAKARAAVPATGCTIRAVADIADEILCLECKDRLTWQDFQRLDALRIELNEANRRAPIAA
ncbi:MAG: hypothetical protein INF52_08980 [Rhodobacter sp.]|nr:hypothetical protein [Rhodobacter sp.]